MLNDDIVSGKDLSEKILQRLAEQVKYQVEENFERQPQLVVVTIGDDQASKVYVRNKEKACEKIGAKFNHITFSADDTFTCIMNRIVKLTNDDSVDGIIIQLPIVSNVLTDFDKQTICSLVPDRLDVDGFGVKSKLVVYEGCKDKEAFYPCTPAGILEILKEIKSRLKSTNEDFTFEGCNALVIGRSDIVGKPIANMLMAENMTVTIAHSKTPKMVLDSLLKTSDVIVSAVGKRLDVSNIERMITALAIVDVGMNRDENNKLCGDLPEDWKRRNSFYYTPVPGGVGPMTVCMLMSNLVKSYMSSLNIRQDLKEYIKAEYGVKI